MTDATPSADTPAYLCDRCGACCRTLLVTVYELDLWREPKLTPHVDFYREPGFDGDVGMLACGAQVPCPFLDVDQSCRIYPTRPSVCVALQAGDEQCQDARHMAGLPPLLPLDELSAFAEFPHESTFTRKGGDVLMSQPEKTFRIGAVSASVFLNEAEGKRPFRSVSLQRRYKDGDNWKSSSSFTLNDLPVVQAVLQMALSYVAPLEAESGD